MSNRYEVTRIDKTDRHNPHERIHRIGGTNWELSQEAAISGILTKKWEFFVSRYGKPVDVIVEYKNNHPYLTTQPDGITQNNLLSLPQM